MALSAGERRGYHRDQYPGTFHQRAADDEELAERRKAEEARGKKAFTPPMRQREVSKALRAYGRWLAPPIREV